MKKRRSFSAEFKARVALEALSGAHTLAELSAKHNVHPNMIAQWKRRAQENLPELFAKKNPAGSVTAIRSPEGIDSGAIVKAYRDDFNAIIANGQGSMKGEIFRIAHLGYFDFHDLFATIAELELILAGLGHKVEFGKGVAAVQKVYAQVASN